LNLLKYILGLLAAGLFFNSCIEPPNFDNSPLITEVQLTKSVLQSGMDTFQVIIYFKDGDGDIGLPTDSTVNNLFLIDSRTDFQYAFTIPEIQENGNINDISGDLRINMFRLPGTTDTDTISFEVYLFDNALNQSNVVTTPSILINCN